MIATTLNDAFWNTYTNGSMRYAVLLVIATEGSTYRKAGARMLIAEDGTQYGMIGGGCFDRLLRERAYEVIATQTGCVIEVDTREVEDAFLGTGLGCQGLMRILLSPFPLGMHRAEAEDYLGVSFSAQAKGFYHIVEACDGYVIGQRLVVEPSLFDAYVEHSVAARSSGKTRTLSRILDPQEHVCPTQVFFEYRPPSRRVFIFGKGDDTRPLLSMLAVVGWHAAVVDPKLTDMSTFSDDVQMRHEDAALVMTHDFALDTAVVEALQRHHGFYVGLLGPRARAERIFSLLRDRGVVLSDSFLNACRSPCGLELGGSGSEAIALSVVAELQSLWSKDIKFLS